MQKKIQHRTNTLYLRSKINKHKKITMKQFFLFFLGIISLNIYSQEPVEPTKAWKTSGSTSISFSQVNLSNWASGGDNSYSLNSLLNLKAEYKKEKVDWTNTLDLGYGILKQGSQGTRKTDDKIDLMSKLGYKAGGKWLYSALINFKTQMDVGYNYEDDNSRTAISELMAPAYLSLALGMEYKPNDAFFLAISPATGRTTFVLNDSLSSIGAFGVTPGKNARHEFGAMIRSTFQKDIVKNVNLLSKVELFSNYADKPQNIDVSWEVLIKMKINDVLSTNLQTHLIYDDDIKTTNNAGISKGPKVQFKEVFGVGLTYKF